VPTVSREHPSQGGEKRAIGCPERWPRLLPTKHRQLMAQNQQLDVLGELAATVTHEQSQQRREREISEGKEHPPMLPEPATDDIGSRNLVLKPFTTVSSCSSAASRQRRMAYRGSSPSPMCAMTTAPLREHPVNGPERCDRAERESRPHRRLELLHCEVTFANVSRRREPRLAHLMQFRIVCERDLVPGQERDVAFISLDTPEDHALETRRGGSGNSIRLAGCDSRAEGLRL